VTANPEFPSVPVAVVVNAAAPAVDPVYVHEKVMEAPPTSVTGIAGIGPAAFVAPPGPVTTKSGALTPLAVACPVFVTVSVTSTPFPTHTGVPYAATDPASTAGVCTVADSTARPMTGPPHAVPTAERVQFTNPDPDAE
jgi:hypothetical protein